MKITVHSFISEAEESGKNYVIAIHTSSKLRENSAFSRYFKKNINN